PRRFRDDWAGQPRYARQHWGECVKYRIASQLEFIRDWQVIEGNYEEAPDITAHWHCDPPHVRAGENYRFHHINRSALREWCMRRKGFLQVIEGAGADWLPFEEFAPTSGFRTRNRYSTQVIYESYPEVNIRE